MIGHNFWAAVDELLATCEVRIDRPKGSCHPRYPRLVYPLDYGFLESTRAGDGNCIDVWSGSLPERVVNAVAVTVDLTKRDSEIKLLLGCTDEEIGIVFSFLNEGSMSAVIVRRDDSNQAGNAP